MFFEEWPLLMFTILTQAAAGTFFLLTFFRSLQTPELTKQMESSARTGITAVGPLMVLAFLSSFFHLGSPTGAFAATPNLDSWMVREVFATSLFFALWVLCFIKSRQAPPAAGLQWATALAGLVAVFFMAGAYTHSIRPVWIHWNTYLTFFGSTFILGALGTALTVAVGNGKQPLPAELFDLLRRIILIAAIAVLIPLLYQPLFISGLNAGDPAAVDSARLFTRDYLILLICRWLLTLAGLTALVYGVFIQAAKLRSLPLQSAYAAAGLLIAGEIIGRYLFFVTAVSMQIGYLK